MKKREIIEKLLSHYGSKQYLKRIEMFQKKSLILSYLLEENLRYFSFFPVEELHESRA